MISYVVRRILATIPVMAVVALFVFGPLHFSPGDPAAIIAGDNATSEDIAAFMPPSGWIGRFTSSSAPGCGGCCTLISAYRYLRACQSPS